ncbi:MAG: efflux RND transporter periplasmic adaptor subunit [Desulfobacterales bacterium]|nr:MAG: efflux RND transporter periplasmic adaptor subunit [Desulfobacterales bacterium]
MRSLIKRAIVGIIVLGVFGTGAGWYLNRRNGPTLAYRTAQVKRGNLLVSISATGTLEPEEVIDVGAQVAGQILSFGTDVNGKPVDYGSVVENGTILAKIDDSLYAADAAQAEAQVAAAQAGVQRAEADLGQLKARLNQAERDWRRARKLGPSEALAEASYDAYQSAYQTAVANVAVGQAAILQARAGLAQAEAVLRRARRNLGYSTITSPVKGVIIDRRVNIGQTVVASLNAPSLFLIAKDLRRMQVWVAVNEADIGKIRAGQPVTFTVDAFPEETFRGEVGKVRLNASMTQNVVTYTVEIVTDNRDGRLLPYLTANVRFELNRRDAVLSVPNAALRWTPPVAQVAPEFREAFARAAARKEKRESAPRSVSRSDRPQGEVVKPGVLWIPDGQFVRPVRGRAGLTDGALTEVEGDGLTEGLEIVTGQETQASVASDTTNPFAPKIPRRGGGSSRPR